MDEPTQYEYVDADSIPKELICSICLDPFIDPVEHFSPTCGNEFCQKCVASLQDCPLCRNELTIRPVTARRLLSPLNQLRVYCPTCRNIIERSEYAAHIKNCVIGCKTLVHVGKQKEHESVCEMRIVKCEAATVLCRWTGKFVDLANHCAVCPYVQLKPLLSMFLKMKDDFEFRDLRNIDFSGIKLSGKNFTGCDFTGANLSRADLSGCILVGTNFTNADLSYTDLSDAEIKGADFTNANTSYATGLDNTTKKRKVIMVEDNEVVDITMENSGPSETVPYYNRLLKKSLVQVQKPKVKRAKKDPNAPKRSKSAYMYFCEANREVVKKDMPDLKQPQILSELGKRWKELTNSDKKKYEELAVKDKERYQKEKSAYMSKKEEKSSKKEISDSSDSSSSSEEEDTSSSSSDSDSSSSSSEEEKPMRSKTVKKSVTKKPTKKNQESEEEEE